MIDRVVRPLYLTFCPIRAWPTLLTPGHAGPHADLLVLRRENQVPRRATPKPPLTWADRF